VYTPYSPCMSTPLGNTTQFRCLLTEGASTATVSCQINISSGIVKTYSY